MEESILKTIRELLGYGADNPAWDIELISNINTSLMRLGQLGVGPTEGFRINGTTQVWSDFIGDRKDLEGIKSYIYGKARIVFDPPASSAALQALKEEVKELEFCINVQVD